MWQTWFVVPESIIQDSFIADSEERNLPVEDCSVLRISFAEKVPTWLIWVWGERSSRFSWRKMLVRNWHCCDVSWIPFTSCSLEKGSKKVSNNHIIGLGCPIGEFVARREPMPFITGVDSVAKTITKSANFYSRRKLWGFNIKSTLQKQTASV